MGNPSFYDKDFIHPSKNDLSHNKNLQLSTTDYDRIFAKKSWMTAVPPPFSGGKSTSERFPLQLVYESCLFVIRVVGDAADIK